MSLGNSVGGTSGRGRGFLAGLSGRGLPLGQTSPTSVSQSPSGGGRGQFFKQVGSPRQSDSSESETKTVQKGGKNAVDSLEEELENFKPMHEAFNDPNFNSYIGSGPGSNLSTSQHVHGRKESNKCVKLHVVNIPSHLSQRAVENIFTLYGDPTNVFVSPCSGLTTWGFVEYKKLEEATNAINCLDRKPPHNFGVKFAKEKESKDTDSEDINTPYCKVDMSHKGRKTLPLQGVDPKKIEPKRSNYNDRNAVQSNVYHNGQFSNYNATRQVEVNNIVTEELTKERKSKKGRVVRGGRAYNPPRPPPKPEPKKFDPSMSVFKDPVHPEEVNPPDVTCPFKQGNCTKCQAVSATVCNVCKAWYCSYTCMETDWVEHKLICRPKKVTFEPDGTIVYHDSQDQDRNLSDQKRTSQHDQIRPIQPERLPPVGPTIHDTSVKTRNDNSVVPKRSSLEEDTRRENLEENKKAEESKQTSQHKDDSKSAIVDRKIDYVQHPPEPRDDGYVQTQNGVTTNRNAKFEANIQKRDLEPQTRNHFGGVNQSSELNKPAAPIIKKKLSPEPPIPRGEFTNCLILYTTQNDERFAVTPIALADKLDEMMITLAEHFCVPRDKIRNLSEGSMCGSLFEDDLWYRVRITSVDKCADTAKIYFIDFGNANEVPIDGLRELPEELLEIPPMAFQITFVGGKKPLQINNTVEITPIKPTPCGSWLVRTPEDPELPEQTEEAAAEELPEEVVEEVQPAQEDYSLSKNKFMPVTIMHVEEPGIFWVVTLEGIHALIELNKSLEENSRSKIKIIPEKGQVYKCLFSEIWSRALVTDVDPCKVFFIDYGNALEVNPEELLPLPLKLKSLCPLAIRIKLAEGTSSKYYTSEAMQNLSIRALAKVQNVVVVLVEGESYVQSVLDHELSQAAEPPKPKRPNHVLSMLTPKSDAFVIITKAFGEDYFCGSLHISNCPEPFQSVDAISKILKTKKANPSYVPVVNDDVIAKINQDSRLYRGYVMCVEEEGASVALVDLGCVETPCKLAPLPQDFKDIPPCGVRIALHTPTTSSLSALLGSELSLESIEVSGEEVTANLGSFGRATITPWVPLIEEARIPAFKLDDKSSAIITAFHSPQVVYVRPLTPACIEAFSCVIQDVCAFCMTAEPLQKPPLLGELVAARWNVDNNFYRALVSKKENDSFKVIFLDFGNLETAVLDDLRKLPDNFKKIPATVVKIGLKDVPGPVFNVTATKFMNDDVVSKEIKCVVSHEGDLRNVILTEESSGNLVNTILAQAMEPSWTKNPSNMYKIRSFMSTDIRYDQWDVGTKLEGVVVGVQSYNNIFFINRSDLLDYVHQVMTPQMTKYCSESKEARYNPRGGELVLAKYEGDWYRAVVVDENRMTFDSTAMVFFIDYGNFGEMAIEDLRKMAPEFAVIPAVVKRCKIAGLPRSETLSEETKKQITDEITALENFELVVVKDFEEGYSVVWVPALQTALSKLGITLNRPVGFS